MKLVAYLGQVNIRCHGVPQGAYKNQLFRKLLNAELNVFALRNYI
jgi:hypothetical protein